MTTPSDQPKERNLGGRPREYDREEMARRLLAWSTKEDSLNLNGFCAQEGLSPTRVLAWKAEGGRFCEAYEETRAVLADRREKLLALGKVHVKAYDLNATVYDKFLKEERQSTLEHEVKTKAKAESENMNPALLSEIAKIKASNK